MARRYISNFGLIIAIVVLSVARITISQDPISRALDSILGPITGFGSSLSFSSEASDSTGDTSTEVQQLLTENSALRKELQAGPGVELKTVAAEISAKSIQSYRQIVRINIGRGDGVSRDDAVIAEGQLVGTVVEVFDVSARVMLITDPDFRAAAIASGSTAQGIVKTETGSLLFDQVSINSETLSGARVQTSGLGGLFPPNLTIGQIGSQLSEPDDIFGTYALRKELNIGSLQFVRVVVQ